MKNLILILLILFVNKELIAQLDSIQIDKNVVYKEFKYKNSNISSKGYLKNNQPTGFWKSYYMTGIIKSEGKW